MKKITKKEQAVLEAAIDALYSKTNVDKCSYKTYMQAITLLECFETLFDEKITYNEPDEAEVCTIRMIALYSAVMALGIDCDNSTEQCLYSRLFLNISNTIVAITKLAEDGFDYQAMSLIRNLFELYMTLIIVTDSPDKRVAFIESHESEDARKVWHRYFTKTKFLMMLRNYCDTRPELKNVVNDVDKWINENYGELSSYAHNDYLHTVLCTSSQEDENGLSHPNVWGQYVTWRARIYYQMYLIAVPAHFLFCYMLKDPQNDITMDYLLGTKNAHNIGTDIIWELQTILEALVQYQLTDHP